ncbi:hypothetical protein Tco_1457063 [Tanacetum coccineum]
MWQPLIGQPHDVAADVASTSSLTWQVKADGQWWSTSPVNGGYGGRPLVNHPLTTGQRWLTAGQRWVWIGSGQGLGRVGFHVAPPEWVTWPELLPREVEIDLRLCFEGLMEPKTYYEDNFYLSRLSAP